MIGSFELPTFSNNHHQGAGFHGSPVEAKARSDERSWRSNGAGNGAGTLLSPSAVPPPRECPNAAEAFVGTGVSPHQLALPNAHSSGVELNRAATGLFSIYRRTFSKCSASRMYRSK